MSGNNNVDDEQDYRYELVSFPGYEDENGKLLIDIVLGSWISFKRNKLKHVVKYPPPPYDGTTLRELNKLLKNFGSAPDYWAEYEIDFKGRAKTLNEAKVRLNKLKNQEYAYTTDTEHTGKHMAEATKQKYRVPNLKVSLQKEEGIFQVSKPSKPLGNFDSEENLSSTDSNRLTSSDDSTSSPKEKKGYKKQKTIIPPKKKLSPNRSPRSDDSMEPPAKKKKSSPKRTPKKQPSKNEDLDIFEEEITAEEKDFSRLTNSSDDSTSSQKGKKVYKKQKTIIPQKKESNPPKKQPIRKEDLDLFGEALTAKEKENPALLFMKIMKALHIIYLENKETQRKVRDIETMLISSGVNLDLPRSFAEKYDLSLPFRKLEDFLTFESLLKSKSTLRFEFKQTFNDLMDRNGSLSRSQLNILKHYIAREVLILYNAVKKTDQKDLIFKNTEFYKCMLDIITKRFKVEGKILTEKEFLKILGPVITNAVDWDGHRSLRTNKKKLDLQDVEIVFQDLIVNEAE